MGAFTKKYSLLCVAMFLICCIGMPRYGYSFDISCWKQWTVYIFQHGLGNVYHSQTNYLPLLHYILKVLGLSQGSVEAINAHIHYLKSIVLIFHFITGYFIALLIKREENTWNKVILNVFLFYLFNIAVLYNTVIWGQVDAILSCLVFITCYFAFKKRILASLIFITLAINFKIQAVIFVPVVGLLILPVLISTFSIKKLAQWILIPLLLQLLILTPFIIEGTYLQIWYVTRISAGMFKVVSMNAFNLWYLFSSMDLLTSSADTNTFIGISYRNWGLLMFFVSSGLALFPLAQYAYLSIVKRIELNIPLEKILITCALIPFLFFYFNTEMHERYSDPAFAFLISYALYKKKPFIAVIGCLAYFLNLESAYRHLDPSYYTSFIFNPCFASCLYLLTIVLLFCELFDLKFKKNIPYIFSK